MKNFNSFKSSYLKVKTLCLRNIFYVGNKYNLQYFGEKMDFNSQNSYKKLFMKISFQIRNSNINREKIKNEIIIDEYKVEDNFYEPKENLNFENNLCKLYEYNNYYASRKALIVFIMFVSYLIYHFIGKVRHHKNAKNYFRMTFYGMLIIFSIYFIRLPRAFSSIIKDIYLCPNGQNIILSHPQYLIFIKNRNVDISKIQRPMKVDDSAKELMSYGYPILIEGQLYTIARNGIIHNKEILPVVLNGKYINTHFRT